MPLFAPGAGRVLGRHQVADTLFYSGVIELTCGHQPQKRP